MDFLDDPDGLVGVSLLGVKLCQQRRAAHGYGCFQLGPHKFFQRADGLIDFSHFLAGGGSKEKRLVAVTRVFFQRAKLG